MLNILIQYTLLTVCNLNTLYDKSHGVSIETHVYNSSVTLLLATAYILVGNLFYYVYKHMTHRISAWNPDLDRYNTVDDEAFGTQCAAWDVERQRKPNVLRAQTPEDELLDDIDPAKGGTSGPTDKMTSAVALSTPFQIGGCEQTSTHEGAGTTDSHEVSRAMSQQACGSVRQETRPLINDTLSVVGSESGIGEEISDIDFFVRVYGYGITIFVIYYAVDMIVLAPSLTILTGLIILSFRDIYYVFTSEIIEEDLLLSKIMTTLSLSLTLISMAELLASTIAIVDIGSWPDDTPSNILFTYFLPYVCCLVLAALPRSCSNSATIRRAMPTSIFISISIVVMIHSVDMVIANYESNVESAFGSVEETIEEFNTANHEGDNSDSLSPIVVPLFTKVSGNLSVAMIILTPLLKLALTFSVITGSVNRKTTELAAFMTFLTSIKEIHMQTAPGALDHIIRASFISGCATLFSIVRYCRPLLVCLRA